jgi:hypothetical protein
MIPFGLVLTLIQDIEFRFLTRSEKVNYKFGITPDIDRSWQRIMDWH